MLEKKSKYIHKSHNVSVLLYHLVSSAKYRRVVFSEKVDATLRDICLGIADRYEIIFLEIGTDDDHVHFLIQSVPMYSPKKIVQTVKSITAREIFKRRSEVKEQLWGGEFWGKGYFIDTVGQHGNEYVIANYVKNQGREKEYKKLHSQQLQLDLF
jgi:REP element-mobilizing transposase RayT